uniref:Uncharacterized protein n=1 Tax=Romanomermis culicivorax TaxID=13658 RepID=A0A915JIY1_ROMCU
MFDRMTEQELINIAKLADEGVQTSMWRDKEAVNKHYGSAATDIGFLLASAYSPKLSGMAKTAGNSLLETRSKFSGYALKTLGFGIQRAISIYVFVDLIENAVAYGKDPTNTDAGIGLAVDGAFITMDLLATAAGAFGAFAFIIPATQIATVLLIVGMNVYETAKNVKQIEQIVPMNAGQLIDESLRAFFHM